MYYLVHKESSRVAADLRNLIVVVLNMFFMYIYWWVINIIWEYLSQYKFYGAAQERLWSTCSLWAVVCLPVY